MDAKWENVECFSSNNQEEDYQDMMDIGFQFEDLVKTSPDKKKDKKKVVDLSRGKIPDS